MYARKGPGAAGHASLLLQACIMYPTSMYPTSMFPTQS